MTASRREPRTVLRNAASDGCKSLPASEVGTLSIADALTELEEARQKALARGQAAAAVSATMAKARLAGLLGDHGGHVTIMPPAPKRSLSEAARRINFLLNLAADEDPRGERDGPS